MIISLLIISAKRKLREVDPVAWSRLQNEWRLSSDSLLSLKPFLIAVVISAVVLAAVWMWRNGKLLRLRSGSVQIFHDVVKGFGLTATDKWLLIRVAHQQDLPSPITLILSESTFEHHTQAYTSSVSSYQRTKIKPKMDRIRHLIFS